VGLSGTTAVTNSRSLVFRLPGAGFCLGTLFSLGLVALWLFKPWQRESDSQLRVFNAFERLLARHGLRRMPG
ncbi:transglutaminase-like domain-containing protein, partial [Pseudomonas syringae pv. pisi str. 1704B]